MKRRYMAVISVLLLLVIALTGCRKKINEQGAEESSNINIITEDDAESKDFVDPESLLDDVTVTEEWDSTEEENEQQKVDNSNAEENEQQSDDSQVNDSTDSNTLQELSNIPFA